MGRKKTKIRVGDKIKYYKPLGGTLEVKVDAIEAHVVEADLAVLSDPRTVLHLSNNKWMRGVDFLADQSSRAGTTCSES